MKTFSTNKEIITAFCEKNLTAHTDWTGTRIETKYKCDNLEKFIDKLMQHIEDNDLNVVLK